LYCVVPYAWQLVHWEFTVIVPVAQLGVVCPPWQLTLEQERAVALNDADPVFALYADKNAVSPGETRREFFPGLALAWS